MTSSRWLRLLRAAAGVLLASRMACVDAEPSQQETPTGWGTVISAALTPDGQSFIYLLSRDEKTTAVIRRTASDDEHRYPAAGSLKMSRSGRWIGFLTPANGVKLVEVASGRTLEWPRVQDFWFLGETDDRYILLQGPSGELAVKETSGGTRASWTGVTQFAKDPKGARIAFADATGLQLYEVRTRQTEALEAKAGAAYTKLTWSEDGTALAAVRGSSLVAFTGVHSGTLRKSEVAGITRDYALADTQEILWHSDGLGVYFRVKALPKPASKGTPGLVLWHWRDPDLPEWKKNVSSEPRIEWAFFSLANRRYVQLSDERLPEVTPQRRGRYALGYDTSAYPWWTRGPVHPRDYYLIDLKTGARTQVLKELWTIAVPWLSAQPQLSPDGTVLLYQDNAGDYIAYDVASGTRRNLTAGLPTKFYYEENHPKQRRIVRENVTRSEPLAGWSSDGAHVLISDYYDIWALPLRGRGKAMNLTGSGRRANRSFRPTALTDEGELQGGYLRRFLPAGADQRVDLNQPMYFEVYDPDAARYGFARRMPAQGHAEILYLERAQFRHYKARDAEVYVNLVTTDKEPPDYFLWGRDWRPAKRLTDTNHEERMQKRLAGIKNLRYMAANGEPHYARLYLPMGYEAGKRYPAIVSVYEETQGIPSYDYPPPDDHAYRRWLQKGYAILHPSIRPRLGEPGKSAVETVTAAVDAAVASGVVDQDRLGLTGYSFGAYETAYIISQTNRFKAAMMKAGVTNLLSLYGDVYGDGVSTSVTLEAGKMYLNGPWWTHWNAYIENSPLYHAQKIKTPLLIVHGDEDRAAPFAQSVELFNTLRRMGDKPAVLLQYTGEGHSFTQAQEWDVQLRTEEFFDHFLKDAPAPQWWSEGVAYTEGQAPPPASSQ